MAKQVIPIRFTGLDGIADIDSVPGKLTTLDDLVVFKQTPNGLSFKKRFGITAKTKNIEPSGTVAAGYKIQAFGDELVITDGNIVYSYSGSFNRWVKKGFASDIASNIDLICGNSVNQFLQFIDCDVAYAATNGVASEYLCFVQATSFPVSGNNHSEWFIQDIHTGEIIANGSLGAGGNATNARVVSSGTEFIIFYFDNVGDLKAQHISAVSPTTITAPVTPTAGNVNTSVLFDVMFDSTNNKVLIAYQNTTPTLTIMYYDWVNKVAGTTVAYATRNPDKCLGFLDYTQANGNGYIAIGTSASGMRVLTFPTATLVVGTDTQVDAAATDALNCTGYFSTERNVFYTRPGATNRDDFISGWFNGSGYVAMRSASIMSRPFAQNSSERYMMIAHQTDNGSTTSQQNLYLMRTDLNTTVRSGNRIAGYLMNGVFGYRAYIRRGPCGYALPPSGIAYLSAPLWNGNSFSSGVAAIGMSRISLDFSGNKTGNLIQFNGGLFFPTSAAKVYDGDYVTENGFYVRPDKLTATQGGGGTLPTVSTYGLIAVYAFVDGNGKTWRSAPSTPLLVTLTGANNSITVTVPTLRITDRSSVYQIDSTRFFKEATIELYATKANENNYFIANAVLNNVTVDTVNFTYSAPVGGSTEILYTNSGELPNEYPPAVLSFCAHNDRLFATSGDGAVWHTKEIVDGDAAASSALFRIPFDKTSGSLVGMASMDTGLLVSKRNKIFLVTGQGPTPDGNSPYPYPLQLPAEVGFLSARSFCNVQDGIIFKSPNGFMLLNRGGVVEVIPGAEAYDAFTATGGVALDDRSYVVISSTNDTSVVYDWQFKVWYAWNGTGVVVNACKWQNQLVYLQSDGTVQVETPNSYSDNGSNIQSRLLGRINVGEVFSNSRTYNVQFLLSPKATFTLSCTLNYEFGVSDPARTKSVNVNDTGYFIVPLGPGRGNTQTIRFTISESSTTQGYEISSIAILVQMKQGSRKQPTSRFLT